MLTTAPQNCLRPALLYAEPLGEPGEKPVQDGSSLHADDAVGRTGHPQVADIRRAAR